MSIKSILGRIFSGSNVPYKQEEGPRPAAGRAVETAATWPPSNEYESRDCINCTRTAFRGEAFCEVCGRPLRQPVVDPKLLAAAVGCMLDTKAAVATPKSHKKESTTSNSVLLAYNDRCQLHRDEKALGAFLGGGHPERPERATAIMARLQESGLIKRCLHTMGRDATREELLAVHDKELIAAVEKATVLAGKAAELAKRSWYGPEDAILESMEMTDRKYIGDVYFNSATAACARLAAGSAAEVASRVASGGARHGAAIIRPPGHHAESSVAMGFCYYNNAAVAARAAQAAGARRVVIMDWDVHHGNGTQKIFYDDPTVLYMSTHRYDHGCFYPGTGGEAETGSGPGVGFTINVPWNGSGVRDADMLAAFRHIILPVAAEFRPDLVIVSAGFDAVAGDPLGGCRVTPAGFSHFAAMLSSLAPTVLLLEGGYNLIATAASTEACLRVLLGEQPMPLASGVPASAVTQVVMDAAASDPWIASGLQGVSDSALESIRRSLRVQSQFWQSAREHLRLVEAAAAERIEKKVREEREKAKALEQEAQLREQQAQPSKPDDATAPPEAQLATGDAAP